MYGLMNVPHKSSTASHNEKTTNSKTFNKSSSYKRVHLLRQNQVKVYQHKKKYEHKKNYKIITTVHNIATDVNNLFRRLTKNTAEQTESQVKQPVGNKAMNCAASPALPTL